MKLHGKLRSVTFFLAICASGISASFCILLMAGEHQSARYRLEIHSLEFQGWEACKQTKPAYFKDNAEAVTVCIKALNEARDNFWVKIPKVQLAGLFVLAGVGGAISGYLVTWIVVWFGGSGIYRFIRWLGLCFRRHSEHKKLLAQKIAEEVVKREEAQRHLSNKKAVFSDWKLVGSKPK
jgi:hypothetical protein